MVVSEKTLPELKAEYKKAERLGYDTFAFQGATLYLGYAKYLIEYLEGEFEGVKQQETDGVKRNNRPD